MANRKDKKNKPKVLEFKNKKASRNYEILETYEAGMVLKGNEIKSIRESKITINEAHIRMGKVHLVLMNAHISQYTHSSEKNFTPTRPITLLLHKAEINKLMGRVQQKGLTIVPLKVYFKKRMAKIQIGLARGKNAPDKRKDIKSKDLKRAAQKAMKDRF